MTEPPSTTIPERPDTRTDGPLTGSARDLLDHWIEYYRETLLLKVAGLDAAQLCQRCVPPSTLSPVGLVRHLTEVEAYWVRVVLEGRDDVPDYYCTPEAPDGDFDDVDPATAIADVAGYEREIADTRAILSGWRDLEAIAHGTRRGKSVNLGWILTHLVEEYARHLGHLDLLRERIDGVTGS